jgi:hypothetical protein
MYFTPTLDTTTQVHFSRCIHFYSTQSAWTLYMQINVVDYHWSAEWKLMWSNPGIVLILNEGYKVRTYFYNSVYILYNLSYKLYYASEYKNKKWVQLD